MKFTFKSGYMPDGCVHWLWDNVGAGNYHKSGMYFIKAENSDWFYSRYYQWDDYLATIEINDEEKAILFALKWL